MHFIASSCGRSRTIGAVNLASVLEKTSEQVLPSVYAYVAKSFHSSPANLGLLTLARSLAQAATSPLGGLAGHALHRGYIVSCGCLFWGICAALFACSSSVATALPVWAMAAASLALIVPNAQSLIADYYESTSRGRAFGVMHLAASGGALIGALLATNIASLGGWDFLQGWRIVFLSAALVAVGVGFLTLAVAEDPRKMAKTRNIDSLDPSLGLRKTLKAAACLLFTEMIALLHVPTFVIIVVQGVFGNIPWSALVYLTLYFQLLGMTPLIASTLVALFMAGVAIGGLLGGQLGDMAAAKWPLHGRIVVAQISVASGIPYAFLLIRALPGAGGAYATATYAIVVFTFGFVKAWPAPAFNNPAFAEIEPESRRTMIYSFDRCFEAALAACTAPLVGLMAQNVFGFSGTAAPTGDAAVDLANAHALGEALLIFMVGPWGIVLALYTGLHWTYGADVRQACAAELNIEAESEPSLQPRVEM